MNCRNRFRISEQIDVYKRQIQSSKVDAPVPGENLKEYFDSLQSVEWNETLVGDLVFFLDENQESIHMGIKGSRNHMFHRKDGVITEEYISDYSEKFVFARLFSTNQVEDVYKRQHQLLHITSRI